MAEQRTRSAKQAAEGTGTAGASTAVANMSTPIFDELLREMAAQQREAQGAERHVKQAESKHRAP